MTSASAPPALPLQGKRIVVTRARAQAGELMARLRALGAEPVPGSAIAIAPPESYAPLDAAIDRLAQYDWVIFTSINGVAAFLERLGAVGQVFGRARIGAIGPATAAALITVGLPPDFVPGTYVAEAIVAEIGDVVGQRILLPRADLARPALAAGLRARGAVVDEVTAYRTVPAPALAHVAGLLQAGQVDAVTFTSSSTVRYFLQGLTATGIASADWHSGPQRPAIVCIGPITAGTARDLGLPVDAVAGEYTIDGLVAALLRWFAALPAERRS